MKLYIEGNCYCPNPIENQGICKICGGKNPIELKVKKRKNELRK